METIFMSWSSRSNILPFAALSLWSGVVLAADVCPARAPHVLRYVDVFDGPPEQLATLVPDVAHPQSGSWELGYVYDAGRIVTFRCKYDDGKQIDVKLAHRVDKCSYTLNSKQELKVSCR
jgi:hypothetical protein